MKRFIICKASAGSGKTYTLVRQYIEIAIASKSHLRDRFEHILAITFTNKAANGMKERIMSQLKKITVFAADDKKTQHLVEEIAAHLKIERDEVVERCKVLQAAILHNYSKFSVCTIDSFVHRIVRSFTHDLNLPMNFDLAIDNQEILKNTVDDLMSLAGKPEETSLTKVLCSFSETQMEKGGNYRLDKRIAKMSNEIFMEQVPDFLKELKDTSFDEFIVIHERLREKIDEYESTLAEKAGEFIAACESAGLEVDDFPGKQSGIMAFMKRVSEGDFSRINEKHQRVDNAYETGEMYCKSTPEAVRSKMSGVFGPYAKAYEAMNDGLVMYNTHRTLLTNLFGLALLNKISQLKEDFYSAKEMVHISEFNKRISAEIANEPAPYIYERIGTRYSNYLIDEFQDTSKMQWQNFLPLMDEAMTCDFSDDTAEAGCQSLVVGDGKQAIYRFRQGDVRQFVQLPKVDSNLHGLSLERNARNEPLNVNYRTKGTVVEFNNRFFEHIIKNSFNKATNPELYSLYIGDDSSGKPELYQKHKDEGGYVQVGFYPKENICEILRKAILHQVEDCGYHFGDIMVLARDNNQLVEIADYLMAHGEENPIPIVSSESFVLKNSRVVRLILQLLHYVYDTDDRVAAVQTVVMISDTGILGPEVSTNDMLWKLQMCHYDLSQMMRYYGIEFNVGSLRSLSYYDTVEELIRIFRLQGKDSSYVATLLDSINNFPVRGRTGLSSLLEYLDEKIDKLSSSTSPEMDAVKLLTIHKAKGLEEKVVINVMPSKGQPNEQIWVHVPGGAEVGLPVSYVYTQKKRTLMSDVFAEEDRLNDMDRINILYVAMTRPEDKLLVICDDKWKKDGVSNCSLLHAYVTDDNNGMRREESESGECYAIGDDCERGEDKDDDEKKPQTECLETVSFPTWEKRIDIASENEKQLSPIEDDSRRYGIMVHDMMAHIITASDIDSVVERFCSANGLGEQIGNEIKTRIHMVVESDENKRYFDPRYMVKCESEIFAYGIIRRPDRIVFAEGETWIIDFKTGAFNAKKHKEYEEQVAEYVALVSAMGYPAVSGKILYI